MWNLRKAIGITVAVGFLSGCESGFTMPAIDLSGLGATAGAPVPVLALYDGTVVAAGPDAYCVDASASRPSTGFALIAACDAISGGTARPVINGLITVQAGATESGIVAGAEDGLRAFLETDAGRAVLSRTGDSSTIDIDGTRTGDGQVTVFLDDTSPNPIAGVTAHEWRSFVDLNGRLVTVSVHALEAAPLSDAAGDRLLDRAVRALIAANAPQSATDA